MLSGVIKWEHWPEWVNYIDSNSKNVINWRLPREIITYSYIMENYKVVSFISFLKQLCTPEKTCYFIFSTETHSQNIALFKKTASQNQV